MENRLDRMPRVTVDDVLEKAQVWRDRYRSAQANGAPNR
jgi:hypothetical protein